MTIQIIDPWDLISKVEADRIINETDAQIDAEYDPEWLELYADASEINLEAAAAMTADALPSSS